MAMALRVFFALGLVFALAEASHLRGDVPEADDPNAQVSQADIEKAMAEATAGDGLSAADINLSADSHESGGEERESAQREEDKEQESERAGEEAVQRKHHTHDASLVRTVKHESRQSQLQALEAKKSAAVAAEDYDEANKIKKEIIALKAKKSEDHTAEIAALEAKKTAAVEAEDYDEATKLKKEITALKGKDSDQPEIQEQQPEQEEKESEPQQSDDGNDDQSHSHKKSLLSTEKAKTQSQEEQPEQQAEQEQAHEHKPVRMTAKVAEETALKSKGGAEEDDEEAKEMAAFDRKHGLSPDGNDKKEEAFQKQMQEVYDSTTETEEDAELEMKASELRHAKKMSNGGEFESVDDVRSKMQKEQHDAQIRKKELAGFDDFFSDAGTDAGKGSVAPHSAAALAALIPAKSSPAASGMGDMGNMMSMFSSMMGGSGGMGDLMGGMDKLSHQDVKKGESEEKPAEHHTAATQDLMKTLSSMAKGGTMDLGALVSLAGGADKGKAKQGLLAIEQAPKAIALGNKVEHATAPKAQIIAKVVAAKAVNFGAVIKKADKAVQEAKVAKETTKVKATEQQLAAREAHAEHTTVDVTHLYDAAKKRMTVDEHKAAQQIAKVPKKTQFSIGQEIEARNQAFDWVPGKVISTSPLMVKRDGDWFANKFDEVRKPVFQGWNLLAHKKPIEEKKVATKPLVASPKQAKKVAAKVATVMKPAVVVVAKPAVVAMAKPAVVAAAKPAAVVATAAAATSAVDDDVEDAEKAAAEIDAEVNAEMGTQ